MKVVITGHTNGVGKSIASYFKSQGHTIVGFSRTNGYDITQESTRSTIINALEDCDVFINSAYAPDAQRQLLLDAINKWEGTTNTIVNINSKASLILNPPDQLKDYSADKKLQTDIIMSRIFKARPHILNVITGLVDTQMAEPFESKKIDPNSLAKLLHTLLEIKSDICVQSILVEVSDLDWNDIKLK